MLPNQNLRKFCFGSIFIYIRKLYLTDKIPLKHHYITIQTKTNDF